MLDSNKNTYLIGVYLRTFNEDFSRKAEEGYAFFCKGILDIKDGRKNVPVEVWWSVSLLITEKTQQPV